MCVSIEVDISCICTKIYIFEEEEIIKSTLLFKYILLLERKKKINCKSFLKQSEKYI